MHPPNITLRRSWALIGWGMVVAVIVGSLIPISLFPAGSFQIGIVDLPPDKTTHAFTYAMLMLWFAQIYPRWVWSRIALGLFTLGVILELLQGLTEYRCFSYGDMGANALGILTGWGLSLAGLSTMLIRLEKRLAMAVH